MNGTDEFPDASPAPAPTDADAKAQATRRPTGAGEHVAAAPAMVDTAALFGGRSEVRLLHRGQEYRLRVTKQGKLILTK